MTEREIHAENQYEHTHIDKLGVEGGVVDGGSLHPMTSLLGATHTRIGGVSPHPSFSPPPSPPIILSLEFLSPLAGQDSVEGISPSLPLALPADQCYPYPLLHLPRVVVASTHT